MGYRGKLAEREWARELRAQAWTINEIVAELGVSKSSVNIWVRDVEFDEAVRAARAGASRNRGARNRRPQRQQRQKQAEIDRLLAEGRERISPLPTATSSSQGRPSTPVRGRRLTARSSSRTATRG